MFITPLFGGCKYTNKILIINNIAVFQYFNLLITHSNLCPNPPSPVPIAVSLAVPSPVLLTRATECTKECNSRNHCAVFGAFQ